MVNYGPDAGKLAVIVDIIDHNRVCVPSLVPFSPLHKFIWKQEDTIYRILNSSRGVMVV